VPLHDITLAIGALLLVLGLIWLATRAARMAGFVRPAPAGGRLRLVQSLSIDPRRRVVVVDCDGRELLLLTGGPNDVALGWLPVSTGPADAP
jgi:flagellar protein FliO/FliZ